MTQISTKSSLSVAFVNNFYIPRNMACPGKSTSKLQQEIIVVSPLTLSTPGKNFSKTTF